MSDGWGNSKLGHMNVLDMESTRETFKCASMESESSRDGIRTNINESADSCAQQAIKKRVNA
jgi:hypothetical protein